MSSGFTPEWLTSENMHILYGPQLHVLYSWAGCKQWHTLWGSHMQTLDSGRPLCWVSLQVHHYQGHVRVQQLLWNTKFIVLTIYIIYISMSLVWSACAVSSLSISWKNILQLQWILLYMYCDSSLYSILSPTCFLRISNISFSAS